MRAFLALVLVGFLALTAQAHFVFVVPSADGKTVRVVFSDDLEPDEAVDIGKIAGLKLSGRSADGKDVPIALKAEKHHLSAAVNPTEVRCLQGTVLYGISTRIDAKPTLLIYHPKAIFAGSDPKAVAINDKAVLEVVPTTDAGKTRFRLLALGKPVADSEGSVTLPDGKKEAIKTNAEGYTATFDAPGRYAVWLRHAEARAGEHDGKKYEEVRHYATLVVDVSVKGK